MVDENYNDSFEGELPPPDEAWWQMVLKEEGLRYAEPSFDYVMDYLDEGIDPGEPHAVAKSSIDWEYASRIYDSDQSMTMIITGYNRGGLLVQGENISGFVPISHIVSLDHKENNHNENLQKLVGLSIQLKLIECDPERGRIVFSERAAQSGPGTRKKILNTLKPGDCVTGRVTNIKNFGIFVDLGGVEGLIHVSEISWGRVQHPNDAAQIGQVLEVYVIQVDQASSRIALSLKRLSPNPWLTVCQLYQPGQVTEAEITSLDTYGAFARLANGLDGLIHISEIESNKPISHPKEMIHCGQKVKVRILHIDSTNKRLGLSLKLADETTSGSQ